MLLNISDPYFHAFVDLFSAATGNAKYALHQKFDPSNQMQLKKHDKSMANLH